MAGGAGGLAMTRMAVAPASMTAIDLAEVLEFLGARETQSMFLTANLLGQGQAMDAWLARDSGRIAGVFGRTEGGIILPQWPGGDWNAAARPLAGGTVEGLIGTAEQVAALRPALGLVAAPTRQDGAEPGYRLDLPILRLPDCSGFALSPIDDLATVGGWRAACESELFAASPAEARAKAPAKVARWQSAYSHRVLWHLGQPVALTGFNARLPEVAQVGGVLVPPALRGRGHARRAVGLHLAEARGHGLRRAVLFAASIAAARAYEALGVQPAGVIGLILFPPGQCVSPCP